MAEGLGALRVLVVDDNRHMREIVATLLAVVGIRDIRQVNDGQQAFEMLRQWPADLAVVDFQMQPMDGVEFTKLVRTSPDSRNPYLPIIMLTGHAQMSRVVEARQAGVTEFLVKPITATSLLGRLHVVIEKPRAFVRTADYFGPDRRRRQDPDHKGPWRRATDGMEKPKILAAPDPDDDILWDEATRQ
jgi:CheY-like chemotaxis protein